MVNAQYPETDRACFVCINVVAWACVCAFVRICVFPLCLRVLICILKCMSVYMCVRMCVRACVYHRVFIRLWLLVLI